MDIRRLWCAKAHPFDSESHGALHLGALISQKHHSHCSRQGAMASEILYRFSFIEVPKNVTKFHPLFYYFYEQNGSIV